MHYFDHWMIDADVKMNEQTVDYFAFYFGDDTYSEYEDPVLCEDTYSDSEDHFDLVFGLLKLCIRLYDALAFRDVSNMDVLCSPFDDDLVFDS